MAWVSWRPAACALALAVALVPISGQAGVSDGRTGPMLLAQAGPNLSAARTRVMFAGESARRGQTAEAERLLLEAEKFLADGSEAETAPLRQQIVAVREEIAKANAEANAASLKRAAEQVERAKTELASGNQSAALGALKYAEQIARDVPEAQKADLLAEIDSMRARIAGVAAPAPAVAQPAQPAPAAPTINVSAVRNRIMFARDNAGRDKVDEAERLLQEAEKYLAGGSEQEVAPFRQEIAAVREEIAKVVAATHEKSLQRAAEQVGRAKTELAAGNQSAAQGALKYAEQIARDVPEARKAELLAEIDSVRARIAGGAAPAPAPATAQPAQPAPAASTANLGAARSRILFARESLQRGQAGEVEGKLREAEGYLAGGTEPETASLHAEIAAIRADLAKAGQARPAPATAQPAPATATPSTANLPSARSRISFARESLERGSIDDIERRLQEAEKYLEGGSEAETAPLRAEIAAIRTGRDKVMAAQHAKVVQRARDKLTVAKKHLADGLEDYARSSLEDAEKLLEPLPDGAKVDAAAELAAFRASLPALKSREARDLEQRIVSDLRNAEGNIGSHPQYVEDDLRRAAGRLNADGARRLLGDDTVQALETRIAELRAKLGSSRAADAVDRAAPPLAELEERLGADPYGDADETEAYRIYVDFDALLKRVRGAVYDLPADEPRIAAVLARADAAEAKLSAYGAAWTRRVEIAKLLDGWQRAKSRFAAWESEQPAPPGFGLRPWMMQQTGLAIRDTQYWLADKDNIALLDRYKDDAAIAALQAETRQVHDAAAAKLNAAFNQSLDEAEKLPLPNDGYTLGLPAAFAGEARDWFANTAYAGVNAARAVKLDERWKAEIAAIEARVAADREKMTAEATAAWPSIDAKFKARDDFHPDRAADFVGKTVRLKGVRNRARWDFGGEHAFAIWIDGVAVAGSYEKYVSAAMEKAAERVRYIEDHVDWDVIAVVEGGRCMIRQRVFTTVIDAKTRDELGKIESYHPIDCVKVRVVGLRAGVVAVGP